MVLAVLFISLFVVALVITFAFFPVKFSIRFREPRQSQEAPSPKRNSRPYIEEVYDDPEL